jgi:hypothetical protein
MVNFKILALRALFAEAKPRKAFVTYLAKALELSEAQYFTSSVTLGNTIRPKI